MPDAVTQRSLARESLRPPASGPAQRSRAGPAACGVFQVNETRHKRRGSNRLRRDGGLHIPAASLGYLPNSCRYTAQFLPYFTLAFIGKQTFHGVFSCASPRCHPRSTPNAPRAPDSALGPDDGTGRRDRAQLRRHRRMQRQTKAGSIGPTRGSRSVGNERLRNRRRSTGPTTLPPDDAPQTISPHPHPHGLLCWTHAPVAQLDRAPDFGSGG